jgi:hypothetical protein
VLPEFPHGVQGVGLALLRTALAVIVFSWGSESPRLPNSGFFSVTQVILVACLGLGVFTTSLSSVCCVLALIGLFAVPSVPAARAVEAICVSLSVALLGPGNYSIDSVLYGRRRRIFPLE